MLIFNEVLHWKPIEKLCERLFSALSHWCPFESSQDFPFPCHEELVEKGVQWVTLQFIHDILVELDEVADRMTALLWLTLHFVFHLFRPLERATSDRGAGRSLSFKVEKDCHDADNELISLILLKASFERLSRGIVDDNVFEIVDEERPELPRRTLLGVDFRACPDLQQHHFANATQDCLHATVAVEPPNFVMRHLVTLLSLSHHLTEIVASLAELWDPNTFACHLFRFNAVDIDKVASSFLLTATLTG